MCCCKTKCSLKNCWKNLKDWYRNKPINPIFLSIRDETLNKKFMDGQRNLDYVKLKFCWYVLLIGVVNMYVKDRKNQDAWASRVLLSEIFLSVTIALIISRWKRAYMDFVIVQLITTRILTFFFIVHKIRDRAAGFAKDDIKNLF